MINDEDGYDKLCQAAGDGYKSDVEELLDEGVDVNANYTDGWTALHMAAGQNTSPEVVQLLLSRGANPNAQCTFEGEWYGNTPLIHAFDNDYGVRLSVLQALVDGGADVNIQNNDGQTAMHKACMDIGDYALGNIKFLLKNGASAVDFVDKEGHTAFQQAACTIAGDAEIVKFFIESGTDLTAKCGKDRKTPLHKWTVFWACKHGYVEIIKMLKEKYGADDLNAKGNDGKSPIHIACFYLESQVVKYLIESGVNVNDAKDDDGRLPIHTVCNHQSSWRSNSEVAKCLIAAGADPNATDNHGKTPLHLVYENTSCRLELAEFLIQKGANVNATDNDKNTPLHLAFANQRWEAPMFMMKNGADLNAKNKDGRTPFHFAFEYGREVPLLEVAKLMIDHGANVNVKDKNGETPLHLICRHGKLDLMPLLLGHGANVNEKTVDDGITPLHVACKENHAAVVWFLLRQYPWLVSE